MKTNERHLIAIDLDRTILPDVLTRDAQSVRVLQRAQDAGHVVMIATARPTCMTMPHYRAMGLRAPIATVNGAYLYHPDDAAFPREEHLIDARSVSRLTAAAADIGIQYAWLENDDDIYVVGTPPVTNDYFVELFKRSDIHAVDRLPTLPAGRFFAFAETEAQAYALAALKDTLSNLFMRGPSEAKTGGFYISAFSAQADKWYAVQRAAALCGIDAQNIITFGDEENDRMMVFNAPKGFVMCNAKQSFIDDAARAGAQTTAYSCEEGGVGYELERVLGL